MPADNSGDLGVQKRVKDLVDLGPGYAEDVFDALRLQTFYQQFGPRRRAGRIGHLILSPGVGLRRDDYGAWARETIAMFLTERQSLLLSKYTSLGFAVGCPLFRSRTAVTEKL